MDINKIIQDLLLKNNSVGVPGLGTFLLNYVPSELYSNSNQVTPPSYQLIFTENVDESDNSLINELSKTYIASIPEVKKELEIWLVNMITSTDHEPYEITGVGTIRKVNNKLVFEADSKSILLADNFGLEITRMPLIEIEGEVMKEPISYKPVNIEKPEKKSAWVNLLLIIVAIILLTAGVFMSFQMGYLQAGIGKIKTLFEHKGSLSNVQLATNDTLNGKIDANTLKRNALLYKEGNGRGPDDNSKTLNNSAQKVIKYYLITGSFKKLSQAEVLKNELITKGYTPEILAMHDTLFRVSLESFTNRHKAVEEYIMLTAKEFNNKLWLFSQLTSE